MNENRTMRAIELDVNGSRRQAVVRNAETLLHALRNRWGLTGAKPGCENGDCGACTVLVNGLPIHSCHMLAVEAEGQRLTTIEGLQGTPVQQAFVEKWAIQCGYCTPGLALTCHSLIAHHPNADEETVADWLRPHLCRCTGYEEIKDAVKAVLEGSERA